MENFINSLIVTFCLGLAGVIAIIGGTLQFVKGRPEGTPAHDNVHRFMAGIYFSAGIASIYVATFLFGERTLVFILAFQIFLGGLGRLFSIWKRGWPHPKKLWMGYLIPELLLPIIIILCYPNSFLARKETTKYLSPDGKMLDFRTLHTEPEWDELVLITPYSRTCFEDSKCIESSDDTEYFAVFTLENHFVKMLSLDLNQAELNVTLSSRFPRNAAVFKKTKDPRYFEPADSSFIGKDSRNKIKFTLYSPVGNKPFCKLYLSGNGACDFKLISDCENTIDPANFEEEVCVENKMGITKEIAIKYGSSLAK